MPALARGSAGIQRISTRRKFIVAAEHLNRLAGFEIIQRQVHGSAAIMNRAFRWISNEVAQAVRRGIPEHFGHVPRPVGIINQQAKAHFTQPLHHPAESFCCRTLHKSPRLAVKLRLHEIIGASVTDIEFYRRVDRGEIDEFWCEKRFRNRRPGLLCLAAQLLDSSLGSDGKRLPILRPDSPALKTNACRNRFRNPAIITAFEDDIFAVVQAIIREGIHVFCQSPEGIQIKPLDQRVQACAVFEDIQCVVIPAVLTDQSAQFFLDLWRAAVRETPVPLFFYADEILVPDVNFRPECQPVIDDEGIFLQADFVALGAAP